MNIELREHSNGCTYQPEGDQWLALIFLFQDRDVDRESKVIMLTETRKADRRKMADMVTQLAERMGAVVKDRSEDGIWPDSVSLEIVGPRLTRVGIRFHRQRIHETNNIWVCTWNTHYRGATVCFANMFECASFRPYPKYAARNKATRVFYGFDDLMAGLEHDLASLNDGSAFDDEAAREYDARTERSEQPWQQFSRPENGQVAQCQT